MGSVLYGPFVVAAFVPPRHRAFRLPRSGIAGFSFPEAVSDRALRWSSGRVRMWAGREYTPVDAEDLVRRIHTVMRDSQVLPDAKTGVTLHSGPVLKLASAVPSAMGHASGGSLQQQIEALRASLSRSLEPVADRIGGAPPGGPTLRARVGLALIRVMQRLLWWYTRPLQYFAGAAWKHLHDELTLLEALVRLQEENQKQLAGLREEVRQLRSAETGGSGR